MGYTIAAVSKKLGVNSSTLRYYEDLGLLQDVKRNTSGYREYTDDHIGKLEAIDCFKRAGMSIADIQNFFIYEDDIDNNIDEMLELLKTRQEKILEDFRQLYDSYEHILKKLDYYGKIDTSIKSDKKKPQWKEFDKKSYFGEAFRDVSRICNP